MTKPTDEFAKLLSTFSRQHPWHVQLDDDAPAIVKAYIENPPDSNLKMELDKASGSLACDRPQLLSSRFPHLYGLVPETYCGEEVGDFCAERTNRRRVEGDGDPLDICVLTEKDFNRGDIFLNAKPIGGLRMIDGGKADDKIVAVLVSDIEYGHYEDISQCTPGIIERMKHYFLTYKQRTEHSGAHTVEITDVYGREEAHEVIRRSMGDYVTKWGTREQRVEKMRDVLFEALLTKLASDKSLRDRFAAALKGKKPSQGRKKK
ncbi:MAG TPA: inorganic pyrophosphatase [Planktothrix sp.]|jgi:inorganic pyrophosphatase